MKKFNQLSKAEMKKVSGGNPPPGGGGCNVEAACNVVWWVNDGPLPDRGGHAAAGNCGYIGGACYCVSIIPGAPNQQSGDCGI